MGEEGLGTRPVCYGDGVCRVMWWELITKVTVILTDALRRGGVEWLSGRS